MILVKLKIDDPVDAVPGHFFAGIWGVLAVGIFDNHKGLISQDENRGLYFAWQLCALVCIMCWAGSISFIYFYIVKKVGYLRVEPIVEIIGLDRAYFGGLSKKDLHKIK